MQFLTAVSPQSFYTPSWRTEAKYSSRVLTGNWEEERRKVRAEARGPGLRGTTDQERGKRELGPGFKSH